MYELSLAIGLGGPELILVLILVLIVFGAGRIPQLGDALGKGIRNFKKSVTGQDEVEIPAHNPEALGDRSATDAGGASATTTNTDSGAAGG